jgi:hypothetical protein
MAVGDAALDSMSAASSAWRSTGSSSLVSEHQAVGRSSGTSGESGAGAEERAQIVRNQLRMEIVAGGTD